MTKHHNVTLCTLAEQPLIYVFLAGEGGCEASKGHKTGTMVPSPVMHVSHLSSLG